MIHTSQYALRDFNKRLKIALVRARIDGRSIPFQRMLMRMYTVRGYPEEGHRADLNEYLGETYGLRRCKAMCKRRIEIRVLRSVLRNGTSWHDILPPDLDNHPVPGYIEDAFQQGLDTHDVALYLTEPTDTNALEEEGS